MMTAGRDYIGVGCGALIFNEAREILLLKRIKPPEPFKWTIPGGKVRFGERIEDAIVREAKEELGVDIVILKLLGVTNHILSEENSHWIAPAFLAKITNGNPSNMEPDSHFECKWFCMNNLPDKITMTTSNAILLFKNSHYSDNEQNNVKP